MTWQSNLHRPDLFPWSLSNAGSLEIALPEIYAHREKEVISWCPYPTDYCLCTYIFIIVLPPSSSADRDSRDGSLSRGRSLVRISLQRLRGLAAGGDARFALARVDRGLSHGMQRKGLLRPGQMPLPVRIWRKGLQPR